MGLINTMLHVFSNYGGIGLVLDAFMESSFFPIPPDVLLIPLSIANPNLAIFYALITTLSSVAGAIFGRWIGLRYGRKVLRQLMSDQKIEKGNAYFRKYGGYSLAIAGFTPIPYKVFTILSGISHVKLKNVIIWSIIGRGSRFILESIVIILLGKTAESFINNYFGWLSAIAVILIIVIVVICRWLRKKKK